MKFKKCSGEGQGSCKRCSDMGKWNRTWMCLLYSIECYSDYYCRDCVDVVASELGERAEFEES